MFLSKKIFKGIICILDSANKGIIVLHDFMFSDPLCLQHTGKYFQSGNQKFGISH